jgi:hypothetical protein
MLSYKDWKRKHETLDESALMGAIPLGVRVPDTIGVQNPMAQLAYELDEAKKSKKKKKMDGDIEELGPKKPLEKPEDEVPEDDLGDEVPDEDEVDDDDDEAS